MFDESASSRLGHCCWRLQEVKIGDKFRSRCAAGCWPSAANDRSSVASRMKAKSRGDEFDPRPCGVPQPGPGDKADDIGKQIVPLVNNCTWPTQSPRESHLPVLYPDIQWYIMNRNCLFYTVFCVPLVNLYATALDKRAVDWSQSQLSSLPASEKTIQLFDGMSLNGWKGQAEKYFSVRD